MEFTIFLLVIFHRFADTHVELIHVQFVKVFLGLAPVQRLEGYFLLDFLIDLVFLRMLRKQ